MTEKTPQIFLIADHQAMRQILVTQLPHGCALSPLAQLPDIITELANNPPLHRALIIAVIADEHLLKRLNIMGSLIDNLGILYLISDEKLLENPNNIMGDSVLALPLSKTALAGAVKIALAIPPLRMIGLMAFDARQRILRARFDPKIITHLTSKESEILEYLLTNAVERTIPRQELLARLWHYHQDATTHTVASHIYRLRQKFMQILGDEQAASSIIQADDQGYRLMVDGQPASLLSESLAALRNLPRQSPCIDICHLSESDGLCDGCLRSRSEIAAWRSMSEIERAMILPYLTARNRRRQNIPQNIDQINAKPNQVKA